MPATANSLLGLTQANFSSAVKNMSNENYKKVLNSVNQETKRQALLRRFGNTANTTVRNRKKKLLNITRQIENAERRVRSTRKLVASPAEQKLVAYPDGQKLGPEMTAIPATSEKPATSGTPDNRGMEKLANTGKEFNTYRHSPAAKNQQKKRTVALPPPVPVVPRKTQITTFANLAAREGKKIFVNLSYVPVNGIRSFTSDTEAESLLEKHNAPVVVKQDNTKGYLFFIEVFKMNNKSQLLVLPSPTPIVLNGKIVTVPKSEATLLVDDNKNEKTIMAQHSYSKDDKALYSISYEAKLYTDMKGKPFFYYLNQQEFTDNSNDGIPIYDLPSLPNEFLVTG